MKYLFLMIACLFITGISGCQQEVEVSREPAEPAPVDLEKIAEELRIEQAAYAEAWNNKDIDAISEIWANDDDIIIFGAGNRDRVIGWEGPNGVKARYMNAFGSMETVDFKIHDLLIKVTQNGTAAVVTYYVENDYTDMEGNKHKIAPRITVVREKRESAWKTIHAYSSFSLEEMEEMK